MIGFLNSTRAEAMMKSGRSPSLTCTRFLASSSRAVSMYCRYVALLTWPITSMSRNWTGSLMLNFNGNPSLPRGQPQTSQRRISRPYLLSAEEKFDLDLENKFKNPVHHFQMQVSNIQKPETFNGELFGRRVWRKAFGVEGMVQWTVGG